ncbi:hypothetical protein HGM15179_014342 [Zosterops borbonicus]|uniref:Uncharacterized protein n=1 Tax=Zosterops borbonicus TaxID=364589 RepID=A0A8K1G6H0_9PASS|nr:hypothetical protein HGM15179_014342 [Zosterops borbonicus]
MPWTPTELSPKSSAFSISPSLDGNIWLLGAGCFLGEDLAARPTLLFLAGTSQLFPACSQPPWCPTGISSFSLSGAKTAPESSRELQRAPESLGNSRELQTVPESSKQLQTAPESFRQFQTAPEHSREIQRTPESLNSSRELQTAPDSSRELQRAPNHSRDLQTAPDSSKQMQTAPDGSKNSRELP